MVKLLDNEVVAYVVGLTHRSAFVDNGNNVDYLSVDELVNLLVEAPHIHPFEIINCIIWNVCDVCHNPNLVQIVVIEHANRM